MTTVTSDKPTASTRVAPLRWEHVKCNLCGRDEPQLYHRERLPYFDELLDFEIVRCRNCGLVYTNPRLAKHNATYIHAGCDDPGAIEKHARAKAGVFEAALDNIITWQNHLGAKPGGTLLDVGCGTGHFLDRARRRGFEILGIEPADSAADYAAGIMDVPIIKQNIADVNYPPGSFDVITAWDVIEHVADPQAMLHRCSEWLKPSGIMALRFPSSTWQKIKGTVLHSLLSTDRPVFSATMHLYFFNEETFASMASQVGLEVLKAANTPVEPNTDSTLIDGLKIISDRLIRTIEIVSGKRLGNLEVYCRRID